MVREQHRGDGLGAGADDVGVLGRLLHSLANSRAGFLRELLGAAARFAPDANLNAAE